MILQESIIRLLSQQMWLVLVLSLPIIGATALTGILISLIQAVTQIQEQTIQFLLKLVVFGVIMSFTASWMLRSIIAFAKQIILQI